MTTDRAEAARFREEAQRAQLKHLEFIQSVITRMNSNSFLLKGWSATLISALFALAANNTDHRLIIVAWLVIPVFWILDAFYLSQERLFRRLYDHVRLLPIEQVDFAMDTRRFRDGQTSWFAAARSRTILIFHGALFAVSVAVALVIAR
jgi:hypothetical protein